MGKNRVYEYVDYGDSLGIYKYSNHPNLNPDKYQRISIRPKLKLPMGENFYFESEYYYKPAGTDVLTDWRNKFVIKTAAEWLNIEIRYNYKNDSEPAPKIFMKYYEVNGKEVFDRTASFENPGSKKMNVYQIDLPPETSEDVEFNLGKKLFQAAPAHVKEKYGRNQFLHTRTQVGLGNPDSPPADFGDEAKEIAEKLQNTLIIDEIQSDWIQKLQKEGSAKEWTIIKGSDITPEFINKNFVFFHSTYSYSNTIR